MERIYINRNCCLAYAVLALHSVYHSANNTFNATYGRNYCKRRAL